MRLPDQSLPRDGLVLLAWLATAACLALLAPLRRSPMIPWRAGGRDPAAELAQLDDAVERSGWRCQALEVLHADAANAIEAAEDDFEHMLAQCAAVMPLPARGLVRDVLPETDFVFLPVAA